MVCAYAMLGCAPAPFVDVTTREVCDRLCLTYPCYIQPTNLCLLVRACLVPAFVLCMIGELDRFTSIHTWIENLEVLDLCSLIIPIE